MSDEREPLRWAEPGSDCDPLLRRLIGSARAGEGDAALAQRLERAVRAELEAGGGGPPRTAARAGQAWRRWVALATLVLSVVGAGIGAHRARTGSAAAGGPAAGSLQRTHESFADEPERSGSSSAETEGAARRAAPASTSAFANTPTTPPPRSLGGSPTDAPRVPTTRYDTGSRSSDEAQASAMRARPSGSPRQRVGAAADSGESPRPGTLATPADARWSKDARASAKRAKPSGSPRQRVDDAADSVKRRSVATSADAETAPQSPPEAGATRGLAPDTRAVPPELALISAAQRVLRSAPAEALRLTAQHERAYPEGRFSEEREEIAISALRALDDDSAVWRARARAFLARYPRALAAPRIARLLGTPR